MKLRAAEPLHSDRAIKKAPLVGTSGALGEPGDNLLSRISTIIGDNCLTTVFGMGTGMASCLWSPGIRGLRSRLRGPARCDMGRVRLEQARRAFRGL